MIYVASPYSSDLQGQLKIALERQRYEQVLTFTILLMQEGYPAFSPVAYCHPIAINAKLPGTAEYWWNFNRSFLRRADAIFLLRLPGWDQSKGVQLEMKQAQILGIPAVHYGPDFKQIQ